MSERDLEAMISRIKNKIAFYQSDSYKAHIETKRRTAIANLERELKVLEVELCEARKSELSLLLNDPAFDAGKVFVPDDYDCEDDNDGEPGG